MPNGTGLFETPVYQFFGSASPAPSADLGLSLTPASSSAVVGDTVDLNITLSNQLGDSQTGSQPNVTVHALLPEGLTYVSHTFPGGTYDPTTGIGTAASLLTGENVTLTITATMEPAGDSFFQAHANGPVDDPNLANNSAAVEVARLPQQTDIEVTLTVTPTSGPLDTEVDFTLTVTNHGPGPAQEVRVQGLFQLDNFIVDPDSVTSSVGVPSGFSWLVHGFSPLSGESIAMPPGTTETRTFTATPNLDTNKFINRVGVEVTSLTPDPDLSNNRVEIPLNFADPDQDSNLTVTLTASDDNPQPGDIVTFEVLVENLGPDVAQNVWVDIPIPNGFERLTGIFSAPVFPNPTQGIHYVESDLWLVSVMNPASNSTATLYFRATALPEGDREFTVTVSSHSSDPTPGDNTATVTLGIAPESSGLLTLVSAEAISPTQREIVLHLAHSGPGTPIIEESTDLGATDPWTAIPGLSFDAVPGQANLLQTTITRPITNTHLFFRALVQP